MVVATWATQGEGLAIASALVAVPLGLLLGPLGAVAGVLATVLVIWVALPLLARRSGWRIGMYTILRPPPPEGRREARNAG
jgi:hypothetical protein